MHKNIIAISNTNNVYFSYTNIQMSCDNLSKHKNLKATVYVCY